MTNRDISRVLDDVAVGQVIRMRLDADKVAEGHAKWVHCEVQVQGKSYATGVLECTHVHLSRGTLNKTPHGSWFFQAPDVAISSDAVEDVVKMFGACVVRVEVMAAPDDAVEVVG